MRDLRLLRARRVGKGKAHVAHYYSDADYWWPFRSTLCGREFAGEVLTDENLGIVTVCVQCQRHVAAMTEQQAA